MTAEREVVLNLNSKHSMPKIIGRVAVFSVAIVTMYFIVVPSASAHHAWNNYHWARTENNFNLRVVYTLDSSWSGHFLQAIADWNQVPTRGGTTSIQYPSAVTFIPNQNVLTGGCAGEVGRVEVCSGAYGINGWLGLTQIWLADANGHVNQSLMLLNDSYFALPIYDTPEWRQFTVCHELGHTIGLDHADNDFATALGTCMDVSSDPVPNQHPYTHDFEELANIYNHLDTFRSHEYIQDPRITTYAPPAVNWKSSTKSVKFGHRQNLQDPANWGRAVARDGSGNKSVFVRSFKDGSKLITRVNWAPGVNGNKIVRTARNK